MTGGQRDRIRIDTGGGVVTGVHTPPGRAGTPLVVCIHGGSYTSGYFDVPGYSLLDAAIANGLQAIALDRPGYAGSTPLPEDRVSFAANAAVLEAAIVELLERAPAGCPGVVLVGHSIGGAISVHLGAGATSWPLLGLSIHGIGTATPPHLANVWHEAPPLPTVLVPDEARAALMYGPPWTREADIVARAAHTTGPVPRGELLEVYDTWPADAPRLAAGVRVPVQCSMAEFEALWTVDRDRLDAFARLFTGAPFLDAWLFRGVGHNIDHHHAGRSLHLRQLAFALDCAVERRRTAAS